MTAKKLPAGTGTADLKSLHHKPRVLFQGLQIDKAVLDLMSLLVPMTFRSS
jgi:hypothetical protein